MIKIMSSNKNEDPLHNSTEKHVLKEIEKKVHNLDHNETVNNIDENEEFFDANCSIPDKRSMKETDDLGKEPSPIIRTILHWKMIMQAEISSRMIQYWSKML